MRGSWRLGRVSNVFPGDDGRVRNVENQYKQFSPNEQVNVYTGKDHSTIQRPVQKLAVLVPVNEDELEKYMVYIVFITLLGGPSVSAKFLLFTFIAIKTKYTLFSINSWNLGTLAAATTQFRLRAT